MNNKTRLALVCGILVAFGCFVYATAISTSKYSGEAKTQAAIQTESSVQLQPAVQTEVVSESKGSCPYSGKAMAKADCSDKSACSAEKMTKADCSDKSACSSEKMTKAGCSGDSTQKMTSATGGCGKPVQTTEEASVNKVAAAE